MNNIKSTDLDKLTASCNKCNFEVSTIGEYTQIKTKNDTWGIISFHLIGYKGEYKLFHMNKYGKTTFHRQGKNKKYTVEQIISIMLRHDKKLVGFGRTTILAS